MLGYLMLVDSQKPYLYLEVSTKRFFNDLLSQHKHYCAFDVISCCLWEKMKMSSNQDVKGISKANGHALKMVFIAQ